MRKTTRDQKKKVGIRLTVVILLCTFALSAMPISSAENNITYYDRQSYFKELTDKGFPADYAASLAELMLAHPTWTFEPIMVSELNSKYTFDYIIQKETEDQSNNLISPANAYKAFRHPDNTTPYDSGYYAASEEAVAYFMDPRNFLNEQEIFQFEDIRYYERDYSRGVDYILDGTFMEDLVLENGVSVRDYVLSIGEQMSVSPVHIAARMRHEQGVDGTSGIISGRCGDRLWYFYDNQIEYEGSKYVNAPSSGHTEASLSVYNGYYNFFNIGASGTGIFNIYLNAMKRARQGTAEMTDEWDGNASWDKMYKSIYGGIYTLTKSYVSNFQNTLYLQKFNIDPRAYGNFWKQYQQNVGGALSEGRTAYKSYVDAGILESEFVFSIPVYSGMPETASPDPSAGASNYSHRSNPYTYVNYTYYPTEKTVKYGEVRTVSEAKIGSVIELRGYSLHTYGNENYEYSIDGGEFKSVSKQYYRTDANNRYGADYPESTDLNAFQEKLDSYSIGLGYHTFVVRAKTKQGTYYEVAHIDINITGISYDLNGDGAVNNTDITALVRYLSGYNVNFAVDADLNRDGKINNRDLIALVNYLTK